MPTNEERPEPKPEPLTHYSAPDRTARLSRYPDDWNETDIGDAYRRIVPHLWPVAAAVLAAPSSDDRHDLLAQIVRAGLHYLPGAERDLPAGRWYHRIDDPARPDIAMLQCIYCKADWSGNAFGEWCWNCTAGADPNEQR